MKTLDGFEETLKATDQLEQVQKMNSIRQEAAAAVTSELIHTR